MDFKHVVRTGFCILFFLFQSHDVIASDNEQCGNGEKGSISSCYDAERKVVDGKVDFEIHWSPTNITGNQTYQFSLEKLDAPDGTIFDNGTALIQVYIPNLEKPLYDKTQPVSCLELVEHLGPYGPFLKKICPITFPDIKKEAQFLKKFSYTMPPEIPIPMGSYHIKLKVFNEDRLDDDNLFLCLDGWLIFSNVEDCSEVETHKDGNNLQDFVGHLFGNPSGTEHDDL